MNTDIFAGIKRWEMNWNGMTRKLPSVYHYSPTNRSVLFPAHNLRNR